MCRNIKKLFNFEPPATDEEVHLAARQFIRKLSGFQRPSHANEAVFELAVVQVAKVARELIDTLVTNAPTRNRAQEAAKAKQRAARRFAAAEDR